MTSVSMRAVGSLALAAALGGAARRRGADRRHPGLGRLVVGQRLAELRRRSRRASSTAAGIKPDTVFAQSNAAVIQQLAAGSINVSTNSGLVDPIRAIEKGAPVAIVRVEVQAPPYSLLAKPAIKSMRTSRAR